MPLSTRIPLTEIPEPNPKRLALRVTKAAERALHNGHPWLFDQAITEQSASGKAGDLAVIFDHKRRFLAIGLLDPASPLRVKLLAHRQQTKIDGAWMQAQIGAAIEKRAPLAEAGQTGYRLVFGEGDGLPGLVVDRYGETLVMKLYTAVWFPYLRYIVPALLDYLPTSERIILRLSRQLQGQPEATFGWREGAVLAGSPLLANNVPFMENGLLFAANVREGHKTGFFFDQRENRQRVRQLAGGRTVLDLFSYTGGFALYAAAGGAAAVTAVDVSAPALVAAEQNFRLNREAGNTAVSTCPFTPIEADVFAFLAAQNEAQTQYGMVIVDPPSFAKSGEEHGRALHAYAQLVELVLPLVAPNGLLVMASCSSRISEEDFLDAIHDTAEEIDRPLWTQFVTGHPADHPLRPEFPEGRYLKCLFASPID